MTKQPTNARCEVTHVQPSIRRPRCEYIAAALPAATAPAAPANIAYRPQRCHEGVAAASADLSSLLVADGNAGRVVLDGVAVVVVAVDFVLFRPNRPAISLIVLYAVVTVL